MSAASRRASAAADLRQARARFLAEGIAAAGTVPPHIARSWSRCREVGPPATDIEPLARGRLLESREQARTLLQCALPEIDALAEHVTRHGGVVVIANASGLILEELGSADFLPRARRLALAPGVEWTEGSRGTNAIGTALLEREALAVLGGEHFLQENAVLSCAAAPIFDGRGDVVGVLDVTGDSVRMDSHALGLVQIATQQIEHRLLLTQQRGEVLRFHTRPGLLRSSREGLLVVIDGRVVAANRTALRLLVRALPAVLDQPAEQLLGRRWERLDPAGSLLDLPDGRRIAAVVERAAARGVQAPVARSPARVADPHALQADAQAAALAGAVRVLEAGLPVLISGETGSGKEFFARRLHAASARRGGPFVAINCAALPESLIEAELFGYQAGAFTGARRQGMPGHIRQAQGGVLFLDEIGDMPLTLQARLLRVLEDRVVSALGGGKPTAVDFALVSATHCDLPGLVEAGRFRADLMYRLHGHGVQLAPLRERADRERLIAQVFTQAGAAAKGLSLDPSAWQDLLAYPWPGNVRELASVLRALVALADEGQRICAAALPPALRASPVLLDAPAVARASAPANAPLAMSALAGRAIDEALAAAGGNVTLAARRLGLHRSTVHRHLRARRSA